MNASIFTEYELNTQLQNYLRTQIEECDYQIRDVKVILTSDEILEEEDRIWAHRKLEVISFRRFWLVNQLDELTK